jgi:cellulose synthase/poly-beta-1,6-N-acetylglucosamine synthase-like glycosyltransferase
MEWPAVWTVLAVILGTSLGVVLYAYAVYPALIYLLASLQGRPVAAPRSPLDKSPRVSVLISAFNEEKWIRDRVRNALRQSYPSERLDVVIASDGSTDRTTAIVRELAARHPGRIKLFDFSERRGKANVLNDVIPQLTSDLIVLSDANTFFDRAAVSKLARWFADEHVIAVCGKLDLVDAETGRNVDSLYWRYENLLKKCEGRLGALLGANGAVYAIRRSAYVRIPGDTIIDDFVIPLLMKLRTKGSLIYDAEAVATEETPPRVRDEFRRRARIGAGGFQCLARLWPLALPTAGWTSLAFISHKVLRWFAPLLLLLALASNVALAILDPAFRPLLGLQAAFYLTAGICGLLPGNSAPVRWLRLTTLFAAMNFALAVGFWRWLSGSQGATWQRTVR